MGVYFFFRLVPKEKDTKKKGTPATSPVLLRHCHSQTGLELASLRQIAPYLRLTVPTLTHLAYAGGLRGRVLRYGDGYVLEVLIYIDAVMSYIPIRTERTSHYD